MFNNIINFCLGYLEIEIEGYYIERLINQCKANSIFLRDIDRNNTIIIRATISRNDFYKVLEIAKKSQCIITVISKKGLPFIWDKYKNRKVFLSSFFILIVLIIILSKFIWNIEVEGIEGTEVEEIIEQVRDEGLKVGILKQKIDADSLINKIRMKRTDIAWVGIDIKGTNAIIRIIKADPKPEIVDENDYCNIVAIKDGEIKKIYAQNGTAVVKEGDEVKKGDILIAGWMEGNFTGKQYLNANGVVKAKIKYMKSKKIDKKEIKREKTEKKERKIAIKFNNFQINLYKRLSKFEKYDTIYSEKKIKLFPNFYLPIYLIFYTNYEINEVEQLNNYDKAKTYGEQEIKAEMDTLIKGEIINNTTDVIEYDNYYNVIVSYEVIEDIGTKEKIIF